MKGVICGVCVPEVLCWGLALSPLSHTVTMIYIRRDQRLFVVVAVVVFLLLIAASSNDHVPVSVQSKVPKVPQWLKHSNPPDTGRYQPHDIPLLHAKPPSNHHFGTIASTTAETVIPGGAHAPGFTIFDRLYLRAGIFYVVTANPSSWPPRRYLIAKPLEVGAGHQLEPTDEVSRALPILRRNCSVLSTARICNLSIRREPRKFWGNLRCGYLTFQSLCTTIGNL